MDQNIIVQFVCFATSLDAESFITIWRPFVKQSENKSQDLILQQAATSEAGNKFKYVSQHRSSSNDFSYVFMKGRSQVHFPDQKAKIVQIGGYTPVQIQCTHNDLENEVKVMVFLNHNETSLDFFYAQSYHYLNIYQAYFESCAYGYVIEFFVQEQDAPMLVKQLKTRAGIEVALYKECSLLPA